MMSTRAEYVVDKHGTVWLWMDCTKCNKLHASLTQIEPRWHNVWIRKFPGWMNDAGFRATIMNCALENRGSFDECNTTVWLEPKYCCWTRHIVDNTFGCMFSHVWAIQLATDQLSVRWSRPTERVNMPTWSPAHEHNRKHATHSTRRANNNDCAPLAWYAHANTFECITCVVIFACYSRFQTSEYWLENCSLG